MLGLLAYALFSVHDATIKWLVAELPVAEVLFFRSAAIMIVCLAIGRRRLLERALTTRMKAPLVLRSLMVLTAFFLYFTAARSLPLAELLSLYFAAPLIVTVLAVPMLGERVSPGHWLAVLVGFAGVMVVTDPFGLRISLPALLVLVAASLWAYGVILMRQVARHESSLVQIFYVSVVFTVGTGVASVPSWRTPSWGELVLLLGVSVFGGLAQFSLFEFGAARGRFRAGHGRIFLAALGLPPRLCDLGRYPAGCHFRRRRAHPARRALAGGERATGARFLETV